MWLWLALLARFRSAVSSRLQATVDVLASLVRVEDMGFTTVGQSVSGSLGRYAQPQLVQL